MELKAQEVKDLANSKIESQISDVHALIEHSANLGMKAICIDQRIVGLHPRTIKILEEEGFLVTRQRKTIDKEKDLEEDVIFFDWH